MGESDKYFKELKRKAEWAKATDRPIPLNGVIVSKSRRVGNLKFTWWGRSQWYKWRWHGTHIDLGMLSIYDLPQKGPGRWFWRVISVLIKPMRWAYHLRFKKQWGNRAD